MINYKNNAGVVIFKVFNYLIMVATSLICLLPFVNLLAISLSDKSKVAAGEVLFWPIGFNTYAYEFTVLSDRFTTAFFISIQRVLLGVIINLIVIVLTAYPLSKSSKNFKARPFYAWFFIFTMLFSPSLIPSYLVINRLGLINTMWALVLPGALPVFSMIVMLNFFRNLHTELEEAALMDGAGHLRILFQIFIPLSKPSIATITLFCIVNHWNSWFDGIIYMNATEKYPLQSYLQTVIVNPRDVMTVTNLNSRLGELFAFLSNRTSRAAQLFVAMLPILMIYPFLQKYFTAGLVLGSVKG